MSKTTDEILVLLAAARFLDVGKLLAENTNFVRNFRDSNGNTIMHIAIFALEKKLVEIWRNYTRDCYSITELISPREETLSCVNFFHQFIDRLIELECPYHEMNSNGMTSIHLFNNIRINVRYGPSILEVQKRLIYNLERLGIRLYPGRKYVSHFDLLYRNSTKHKAEEVQISDNWEWFNTQDKLNLSLHQRFEILEQYFQRNILSALNLVFVNIGFVIVQRFQGQENKVFITIPIVDALRLVIRNEGRFIHSEKSFYDYLCNEKLLSEIVNTLDGSNLESPKEIYAVVMDVHSTREICHNCESIFHKIQFDYSENSFLRLLEGILMQKGYRMPLGESNNPKLPVTIRITGFEDAKSYGDHNHAYPLPVPCPTYNRNISTHERGAILHIAPKNNEHIYSRLSEDDNEQLRDIYSCRPIYFLKEDSNVLLYLQTAFSASSGQERFRAPNNYYVKLRGEDVLQYRLHLIQAFNKLKLESKEIIKHTRLDNSISMHVLFYLYNIRNPLKEIKEMVELLDNDLRKSNFDTM